MQKNRHFILYKPHGYLSQFVNNGPKKNSKKLLGDLGTFPYGTMAVGRLDEQSEGLLLLTTDGKLSNQICSGGVEKEYYAQVDGVITQQAIEQLSDGIEIERDKQRYQTRHCAARVLNKAPDLPKGRRIRDSRHGPTSWISITLTEGKFRQVRKMTAAVGFPTLRLVRVRIGNIVLGPRLPGEVEEVSSFDI